MRYKNDLFGAINIFWCLPFSLLRQSFSFLSICCSECLIPWIENELEHKSGAEPGLTPPWAPGLGGLVGSVTDLVVILTAAWFKSLLIYRWLFFFFYIWWVICVTDFEACAACWRTPLETDGAAVLSGCQLDCCHWRLLLSSTPPSLSYLKWMLSVPYIFVAYVT
jgi:hypothetical protein